MPPRPINNERKACDAVARSLEHMARLKRMNAHSPEDDGIGPPVEYVFNLGPNRRYALEHTIVEAFEGQIHTGVDFGAFIAPIQAAVDLQLPHPGLYRLTFPIDPSRGLKPKTRAKVQAEIVEWVKLKATELHAECPEQPAKSFKPRGHEAYRRETVAGINLLFNRETGWWMPDQAKGRLLISRFAPQDYDELRRERIANALDKKLPKLQAWKTAGARSVLVLENGDISLSNHAIILDATEHALQGRGDRPDEVWLVDTTIEQEWTVWCLMRDGVSFPDDNSDTRYREFNPSTLAEV
jgi:hypothetical protein